jgi:site-specific recombinase XerD
MVHGKRRWCLDLRVLRRGRPTFKSKALAEAELEVIQGQRKAAGDVWLSLSAAERNELIAVHHEVSQAGLSLRQVWETARNGDQSRLSPSVTLEKAVDEVLTAKRAAKRRQRHLDNLEWYLKLFIKGREAADVRTIGESELNQWFAGRNEAPRSQRGHVGLLSALFTHCWRKRYIHDNPVKRLDPVSIDRHPPAVLTLQQCRRAVLWALRRQRNFLGWLVLCLFVGLRPEAEAEHLEWPDIDLKRKRIVLKRTKTRTPRIIELSFCPPALPWLKIAKKIGPLTLTSISRRRYRRKLSKYLGLKRWPQDILRHTTASNLLAFHEDAGKVGHFLGHSASTLIRDYKALVFKEDAKKFMELLPKRRHRP